MNDRSQMTGSQITGQAADALAGELDAYNAAYLAAQQEGGSREAILAILNAVEPPELGEGKFHRMSFGLEYLLEVTGNGRAVWARRMCGEGAEAAEREAAGMVETLFIYADPAGVLTALGAELDLAAFRRAAVLHSLGWTRERADGALNWAVQDMLRYWKLLPFLEAAARVEAGAALPVKRDGGVPLSIGSLPNTDAGSGERSGGFVQRPRFISGSPPSSGGGQSIPGRVLPTGPGLRPQEHGGQGKRAVLKVGPPGAGNDRSQMGGSQDGQVKPLRNVCGVDCHPGDAACNGYCRDQRIPSPGLKVAEARPARKWHNVPELPEIAPGSARSADVMIESLGGLYKGYWAGAWFSCAEVDLSLHERQPVRWAYLD